MPWSFRPAELLPPNRFENSKSAEVVGQIKVFYLVFPWIADEWMAVDCLMVGLVLRAFEIFPGDRNIALVEKCNAAIRGGLTGWEASSPACPGRIMLGFQHNRPAGHARRPDHP
jgi:hypothetical protein